MKSRMTLWRIDLQMLFIKTTDLFASFNLPEEIFCACFSPSERSHKSSRIFSAQWTQAHGFSKEEESSPGLLKRLHARPKGDLSIFSMHMTLQRREPTPYMQHEDNSIYYMLFVSYNVGDSWSLWAQLPKWRKMFHQDRFEHNGRGSIFHHLSNIDTTLWLSQSLGGRSLWDSLEDRGDLGDDCNHLSNRRHSWFPLLGSPVLDRIDDFHTNPSRKWPADV